MKVDHQSPADFTDQFNRVCIGAWLRPEGAPRLVELAARFLAGEGIDNVDADWLNEQERALARAIVAVAARAEHKPGTMRNFYHDSVHTAHVATAASYLTRSAAARMPVLADRLTVVLAAFAHDIDHPGRNNPLNDPVHNEQTSFQAVHSILAEAGLTGEEIVSLHVMLLATAPGLPHSYLKALSRRAREETLADLSATPAPDDIPELSLLARDRRLLTMTAVLVDSELFASMGAGLKASDIMTERISEELRRAGNGRNISDAAAQEKFLSEVIGEDGFLSDAARTNFNGAFHQLLAEIRGRLNVDRRHGAPAL